MYGYIEYAVSWCSSRVVVYGYGRVWVYKSSRCHVQHQRHVMHHINMGSGFFCMSGIAEEYAKAGQEQVYRFASKLNAEERKQLDAQLAGINPAAVNEVNKAALQWKPSQSGVAPLPSSAVASTIDASEAEINEWRSVGETLISAGKVAVLLLAGGQGTRLGSSAPKGCYDINLPSHKSLFQLQAERIAKLSADFKGTIVWYIMTSGPTRAPTEQFFSQNNYFNLAKENVVFFEQGTLPCVDFDGKIIMDSPCHVAVAPDGNGGVYKALNESGVLENMKTRGIEHVHMYCVDNSLVKVADPVFIGFCSRRQVDIGTKVVRKRNADEQVGVIACRDGHPAVIEYSEISEELRSAKTSDGLLKLRAANIVNHYYSLNFLLKTPDLAKSMPYHIAKKKIPFCNDLCETVKPTNPNGIKFEQFVFDIFSETEMAKFACLEVERSSEFSPVKNAPGSGEDCPETARLDLMVEGQRWLQKAGAKVTNPVEIAPSVSYAGENLEKFANKVIDVDYLS